MAKKKKSANAAKIAAAASTKDGQRTTRDNTNSRKEVCQQTVHRHGHPK
jgi:hypothetical protein